MSYEFFDYKLETEFGELCLNGIAEMKNTFTPLKPTAMCQALIPAAQEVNKINEYAMNHKGQALMIAASGGVIASLELGPIVTSAVATLSSWLGVTREAFARDGEKPLTSEHVNPNKTLKVNFLGGAIQ